MTVVNALLSTRLTTTMSLLKLGAVVVVLACAVLALASRVSRAIKDRKFAAENGCRPILHRFPHKDPLLGLDLIVGNVRAFREQRFMELLRNRHRTIGTTFSARAMARRGIFTIDPENVKTVLSLRFRDYCLGDRPPIMGPLLGRGIFVTDGEEWAHSRALLRPNFVRDQVADLSLVDSHIQNLLDLVHPGETVDLQQLFLRFTLDSATDFLFGHSTHTLTSNGENDREFSRAFNSALEHMALQFRMGPFRKLAPGKANATDAYMVCRAYVDQFVDDSMALRKSQASTAPTSGDEKGRTSPAQPEADDHTPGRNFFLRELAKSTDDRDKIRDELLNILIAGRDTVASLLSSLFHVLARRPDIWRKVKAEIAQQEPGRPTYDQLRNLRYARYCINETLRLYPPVPSNTRVAVRDTVLPRGGGPLGDEPIHVPKGCVVVYSVYAMHRRRELFGDDAEEFRPERWENSKHAWEYLPFNGGPRICLGQQYAVVEALMVVTRFAQRFTSIETRDPLPWTENLTLTMAPAGGVKVALYQ